MDEVRHQPLSQRVIDATTAITQNVMGVNQRTEDEIIRLTVICRLCGHRTKLNFCNGCLCNLTQKIRNASTRCPLDPPKWGTAQEEAARISNKNAPPDMVK